MTAEYRIYKVINLLTGLIYIGCTTKTIEERRYDHEQKAKKGLGSSFQRAIGTYGPDAFSWEQIDTVSDVDELAKKEKYYIALHNSNNIGYNQDSGGGFRKTVYQFMDKDWLINEWPSLSVAAFVVRGKRKSVANACLGYTKTYKGYYWSYSATESFVTKSDLRKKVVVQSDLNGNQLSIFDSVAEASRSSGISKTCIARCCRGEREFSKGFLWKYT